MRHLRIGSWLVAIGIAGHMLHSLAWHVFQQLLSLDLELTGDRIVEFADIANLVDLGFALAIVVGAIWCARASEGRPRRWLFAVAIATVLGQAVPFVPWLLDMTGPSVLWLGRARFLGDLAAMLAYAAAAAQLDTRRGLVRAQIAGIAIAFAVQVIALATAGPLGVASRPILIAGSLSGWLVLIGWLFLVLDVLGAFPARGDAPIATVSAAPRSVAGAAAIALVIVGTGLAAFALWCTRRIASADATEGTLIVGVVLFVIGAFALARMRGRAVPVAGAVAAALALVIIGPRITRAYVVRVQDVELVAQHLPGLSIALPEGGVEREVFTREIGKLTVTPRHSGLGLVELGWMRSERDPSIERARVSMPEIASSPFDDAVGGVTIHGAMWTSDNMADLFASWQCPGDARWFTLEVSRYHPDSSVLHAVGERILHTITCGSDPAGAPPFSLAFTPPPGYRAKPGADPQILGFDGDDGSKYWFVWSADYDYVDTLRSDPAAILDMIGWKDHAAEAERLPDLPIAKHGDVVETDARPAIDVVVGDHRVTATAWHCFGLDLDVVGFFAGPATVSRETALAVLRGARCPH